MAIEKANIVDVEFLAKFYRVEQRTIQLWTKEFAEDFQIEVRYEKGEYDFVKFVHAKNLHYEKTIQKLELGDVTLYELQREYQRLKNEEKKIQVKTLNDQTIDIETVRIVIMEQAYLFGKSMRGLKTILSKMMPDITTYDQRYQINDKYIDEALNQIAKDEIIGSQEQLERELDNVDEEENKIEELEG